MSETKQVEAGYRVVVRDRDGEYPDDYFDFDPSHAIFEMHDRARALYAERYSVGLTDTITVGTTPF